MGIWVKTNFRVRMVDIAFPNEALPEINKVISDFVKSGKYFHSRDFGPCAIDFPELSGKTSMKSFLVNEEFANDLLSQIIDIANKYADHDDKEYGSYQKVNF